MHELIARVNETRSLNGFLTVEDVVGLSACGISVVDPFSTLVSARAKLAPGVFLWPNITIAVGEAGLVSIGRSTTIHSGVRIAVQSGSVVIGSNCDIGQEGGFTFIADEEQDEISIGDDVRLNGGGSIIQSAKIGDGAQILGPIRVQQCQLGRGGSFREHDPDSRGGVLKGTGIARNLNVPAGMVIQSFGLFTEASLRLQSDFHPKTKVEKF